MIDENKVLAKIRVIKENKAKLEKLKGIPEEVFIKDFEKYDSAKYNLQTAIEAMLDICNHIISRGAYGVPKTNADAFVILCHNEVLSPEMQSTYVAMARFRNRVVHLYEQIDTRDVYKYVVEGISDIDHFIDDIARMISRGNANQQD